MVGSVCVAAEYPSACRSRSVGREALHQAALVLSMVSLLLPPCYGYPFMVDGLVSLRSVAFGIPCPLAVLGLPIQISEMERGTEGLRGSPVVAILWRLGSREPVMAAVKVPTGEVQRDCRRGPAD